VGAIVPRVCVVSSSLVVRSGVAGHVWASTVGWPRGEATDCKSVYTGSNPVPTSNSIARAIGAAVARLLDTEECTGSNPVSPTGETAGQRRFPAPKVGSRGTYGEHDGWG